MILEALIRNIGIKTMFHPKPYPVRWIHKDIDIKIKKQCTFKFMITNHYINEVICKVVSLDVYQVILGSPYLWYHDAIHYKRLHKYHLVKDGKEFHINTYRSQSIDNVLTTNQAKRLVNSCGLFILLMIRSQVQFIDVVTFVNKDFNTFTMFLYWEIAEGFQRSFWDV